MKLPIPDSRMKKGFKKLMFMELKQKYTDEGFEKYLWFSVIHREIFYGDWPEYYLNRFWRFLGAA